MKVILKYEEWKNFLESNPTLLNNLWDLIPREMEVEEIEAIVWTSKELYHLSYKDKKWVVWLEHIEEFI